MREFNRIDIHFQVIGGPDITASRFNGTRRTALEIIDVNAVERLLAQARKLLIDVQKVTLSKEKALRTAIKMEEAFNRAHVENVGGFANPAMKSMFTSLARDDAQHMATLQNYCDRVFGKASN